MSRILKVSQGDYRIQVRSGGDIYLDTGLQTGTVTVSGNLTVLGQTTTVNSTNTTIVDNIIQLNQGETGAGITKSVSGIEIERGTLPAAQFVFSEQVTHYDSSEKTLDAPLGNPTKSGTFVARTQDTNGTVLLSGISVRSITTDGQGDLVFDLQDQPVVLRVARTAESGQPGSAYAARLTDDNDIPNLKFVKQYIASTWSAGNPNTQGTALVQSIQYPAVTGATNIQSNLIATASSLDMRISQQLIAQVDITGLNVGGVLFFSGHEISDRSGNANLILHSYNNNVEINSVLNLDDQPDTPVISAVNGATRLYSKATSGVGKSGLYFTNTGAAQSADELMSRRKAVVLSILL
jgi:hypothetical protein